MEKLYEIQKVILNQFIQLPFYHRDYFQTITFDNKITGIVGGRGVGKTTWLLHQAMRAGAEHKKALYASADNLFFLENKLVDLVEQLYKETDVRLLCIDEIHKYPNWNQELKNIADTYQDFRLLFSGSSTIDIIRAKYDLSRRVTLHHLYGFSLREYLEFTLDVKLPKLDFDTLIKSQETFIASLGDIQILKHFKSYLKSGYYPFLHALKQENEKYQTLENSVKKTIYEDIAVLHSLKTPTLLVMEKLYKYVINATPGELNASKLANLLNKDFDSISEYLNLLEQSGLIRFLYPNKTGKAFLRNPIKMYPENTNFIYAAYLPKIQDATIGKIRETFALNQLQNAGLAVYYSEQGDFSVNDIIFEVGGKNKTKQQIKMQSNAFILADGLLTGAKQVIPLYLLGFLY